MTLVKSSKFKEKKILMRKNFFAPNLPIFRIRLAEARRRRKTQAIAKRSAFHANAKRADVKPVHK